MIKLVVKIIPSLGLPLFAQGPRCNGDLVSGCAENAPNSNPVGVVVEVGVHPSGRFVVEPWHSGPFRKTVLSAVVLIVHFKSGLVANGWEYIRILEAPIVDNGGDLNFVFESLGGILDRHNHFHGIAWEQGLVQTIHRKVVKGIPEQNRGSW